MADMADNFDCIDVISDLTKWVRNASAGETVIYHVGLLAADRMYLTKEGTKLVENFAPCDKTALQARQFSDNNDVILTQRRLGEGFSHTKQPSGKDELMDSDWLIWGMYFIVAGVILWWFGVRPDDTDDDDDPNDWFHKHIE